MDRRLAAILAADVVGYSRLMGEAEEETHERLNSYLEIIKQVADRHKGRVFGSFGDSVMAEFPSTIESVLCGIEIQTLLTEQNALLPEDRRMLIRIGVNLAEVLVKNDNIYGDGVNIAARLESLAQPGGIAISGDVFRQVNKKLDCQFEDLGERSVKNIAEPVHAYSVIFGRDASADRRTISINPNLPVVFLPEIRKRSSFLALLPYVAIACAVAIVAIVGIVYFLEFAGTTNHGPSVPNDRPSLVVAPFVDLSAEKQQQYFADGISQELIAGLEKFPDLFVIGRSSSFKYRDSADSPAQMGRDLGVRYVVQGSVQRADGRVRVTAQLVDGSTEGNIWADSYDRPDGEVLNIRDDITRAIAGSLLGYHGKLAGAEIQRLEALDQSKFSAYDFVMKGWYEWYKLEKLSNVAARGYFENAAKIDPSYAPAYAGLAWTYANEYDFSWTDDYVGTAKRALELASTAIRLDPNDYRSHWALGWAYLYSWQHDNAYASYLRARELNPNDAELLAEMANLLIYVGRPKEAIEQLKVAIRLNPFHDRFYDEYLGWAYEEADMPFDAISTLKQTIGPTPTVDDLWLLYSLTAAYSNPKVGQMNEVAEINKKILALEPTFSMKKYAEFVRTTLPYKTEAQVDRWIGALKRSGLPD